MCKFLVVYVLRICCVIEQVDQYWPILGVFFYIFGVKNLKKQNVKKWVSLLPKGVFGVVDLATKSNSPSGRGPWGSETARTQKLKSTVIFFKSLFPRGHEGRGTPLLMPHRFFGVYILSDIFFSFFFPKNNYNDIVSE